MGGIQDFLSKFGMVKQALQGIAGGYFGGDSGGDGATSTDASPDLVAAICPKTPWEKFIAAINSTVKPLLLLSIVLMFHWAAHTPDSFSAFAKAISLLPDMAWYTIFTVVSSWVVIRAIGDYRNTGSSQPVAPPPPTPLAIPSGEAVPTDLGRFGRDDQHHDLIHSMPMGNKAITDWRKKKKAKNAAK